MTLDRVEDYAASFLAYLQPVPAWVPQEAGDPPAAVLVEDLLAKVERILDSAVTDRVAQVQHVIDGWSESRRPSKSVLPDARHRRAAAQSARRAGET